MNEGQLEQMKRIQVEMLTNFIIVCTKLNLRYFALGGTVLGTIRHQGFIPWDDDIDVGMPREDYEKFSNQGQQYLNSGYFLQNYNSDKNYPFNFAKIRNSNTTFIEKSVKNINMNQGIYIDIFPIDGYPKNRIKQLYVNFMKVVYDMRISDSFFFESKPKRSLKSTAINFLYNIVNNSKDIRETVIRKDKLLYKCKYEDSSIVANYCGAWGEKEIMPKHYFGSGLTREFEGIKLVIPEKYDLYLTQMYGDYMKLPPEDKRKTHHYYETIDINKPFEWYLNNRKG